MPKVSASGLTKLRDIIGDLAAAHV